MQMPAVPRSGLVERLRAVKDEAELDAIRRATKVTNEAFARIAEERFVGRTERELAWRMDVLLHELGGHGLAFETHVGAGPNAARPHALGGDRPIGPGETVVVEAGNVVTIEPGIYLPGRGGIRIEDLVVVTADGPEVLTTFTKELLTVG